MLSTPPLTSVTNTLSLQALIIALVAGIVFPPLSAYTSVYLVLAALFAGIILHARHNPYVFGIPSFKTVWVAFGLLAPTILFTPNSINNLYLIVVLAPIPLATGLVLLLHHHPKFATTNGIALLCLIGAAGAVCIALNDLYVFHLPRASGGNNPIHFGGLSLILGFGALIGLFGSPSIWRFTFILGPIFGWTVAIFSGSRGPVLAGFVLAFLSSPFLVRWFWKERGFKITVVLVLGLAVTSLSFGSGWQLDRARSMLGTFSSLVTTSTVVDGSTNARITLYSSAFEAFKEAPILGHGFANFIQAASRHISSEHADLRGSEHLHSDIADFAAIGGLFGLAAYFFLLAAPLFAFVEAKDPAIRRSVFLGGVILSAGYFSLGLTNAMFGILPQTTLFGLLLGVLVSIARTNGGKRARHGSAS